MADDNEELILVATYLSPNQFSGSWSTKEDKLRTGIAIYEELRRSAGWVELHLRSMMVRKMFETITRDQLTNSIVVEGVELDHEAECVMNDIVAQYLAEAAHDIWVFNGCPEDWHRASMEYLESNEFPNLMVGGFKLVFERQPNSKANEADPQNKE